MRIQDFLGRFSGFQDPARAASALLFLHELSAPDTLGQPPRAARWERIVDRPKDEWGEALDRAARACAETWPDQLARFSDGMRFAAEPLHHLEASVDAVGRLAGEAHMHGGPFDRRTLLADVHQEMRSLSSKQRQGSFFTPWGVAEMTGAADAELPRGADEPTVRWRRRVGRPVGGER